MKRFIHENVNSLGMHPFVETEMKEREIRCYSWQTIHAFGGRYYSTTCLHCSGASIIRSLRCKIVDNFLFTLIILQRFNNEDVNSLGMHPFVETEMKERDILC